MLTRHDAVVTGKHDTRMHCLKQWHTGPENATLMVPGIMVDRWFGP